LTGCKLLICSDGHFGAILATAMRIGAHTYRRRGGWPVSEPHVLS
jgi:hypothetical protein